MNVLHACLMPHDAHEVKKNRLLDRNTKDMIAWHYERAGIFSVRSAYKLALQTEMEGSWQDGSSRVPDGN
jgi:hypothetical protein